MRARLRHASRLVLEAGSVGGWHGAVGLAAAANDSDWQPDVAVLPFATFDGNLVTIHNIRNFDYRSETDFTPHYYDKTFDLRQLDSADLMKKPSPCAIIRKSKLS
jgi:hypothetical protein